VILEILLQEEKQPGLSLSTDDGMQIDESDEQLENAQSPITKS
jgi:hypothetical protein